jgi:hypothetical protein
MWSMPHRERRKIKEMADVRWSSWETRVRCASTSVRQELAETIHLNETLGAPSEHAIEKLFAAIDAEEAGGARRRRRRINRTPSLATASTLNNDASGAQCSWEASVRIISDTVSRSREAGHCWSQQWRSHRKRARSQTKVQWWWNAHRGREEVTLFFGTHGVETSWEQKGCGQNE